MSKEFTEYTVCPKGFHRRDIEKAADKIPEWIAEFKDHGFNVSEEAIRHNLEAWTADLKSGFRDEKNGYHLFTPCGCNALRFNAQTLVPEHDWQTTYEC